MVSTRAPSHCTASIRQPRTIAPSTRTVQAPQTPCSQPTWLPVRASASRRKSTSVVRASTRSCTCSPFTVRTMSCMRSLMTAEPPSVAAPHAAAARRRDAAGWRPTPGRRPADRGRCASAATASSRLPSASAASALRARTGVAPTPKYARRTSVSGRLRHARWRRARPSRSRRGGGRTRRSRSGCRDRPPERGWRSARRAASARSRTGS